MILDAVNRRLHINAPTPTLQEIQTRLAELGPASLDASLLSTGLNRQSGLLQEDIGTTKWIEPPLAAQLLRSGAIPHPLCVVEFVIHRETSGVLTKLREYLKRHFSDAGPRTPVMCDDSMFAYTVCGVCLKHSEWQVLVFDPHVTGLDPDSKGLSVENFIDGSAFNLKCSSPPRELGAARWVQFASFFDRARWMFCIPIPFGNNLSLTPGLIDFDRFQLE